MGLSNYDPGQELSSINFAGMIGGPLSAVVNAQSQAALATVDFIKSVGFSPDTEDETTGQVTPGTPVYVTFKYPKMTAPFVPAVLDEDGATVSPATPAEFEQMVLEVPILTMLPIPFIRVDFAEIDFHAKITSMEYQNSASQLKTTTGISVKSDHEDSQSVNLGRFLSVQNKNTSSVTLNVNVSSQKSVKEGHKIDKTFQLGVRVRATQDEMPAGMEKILGILEDAIVAQPLSTHQLTNGTEPESSGSPLQSAQEPALLSSAELTSEAASVSRVSTEPKSTPIP